MNARTLTLVLALFVAGAQAALADSMGTAKPSPTPSSHGSMMSHGMTKASPKPSPHSGSMMTHGSSMMMSHPSPKPSPSPNP